MTNCVATDSNYFKSAIILKSEKRNNMIIKTLQTKPVIRCGLAV